MFLPLSLGVGVVGMLNLYLRRSWRGFQQGIIDGVSEMLLYEWMDRR